MKRLILQTYINDGKDRKTIFTYKPFPKMERLSRNQFKKYAKLNGADYEYYTPDSGEAHWIRMEMFNRPEYDEVLYVDCDILIHPARMKDNIFDYHGQAVNKVHSFRHWDYPDMNAGVTKWTREECEIMKEHIDEFYHPTHNQASINACFKKYCGEITFLPYKFNVTHRPTNETVFRHYPGQLKNPEKLKNDPIWRYYK